MQLTAAIRQPTPIWADWIPGTKDELRLAQRPEVPRSTCAEPVVLRVGPGGAIATRDLRLQLNDLRLQLVDLQLQIVDLLAS